MKLESLHDLYVEELDDLHSAETQIARALPRLAEAASNRQLRGAFEMQQEETKQHARRLEQLLSQTGQQAGRQHCAGVEGLVREAFELLNGDVESEVRDAGLIAAVQKMEHYQISGYGTARTYAEVLGNNWAAQLLQETLNEERQTDEKLNQLALAGINLEAAEEGQRSK